MTIRPLKVLYGVFLVADLIIGTAANADTLVVHEWGTITTRHFADGTPQGRLNRIAPEEVLPKFVHTWEAPRSGGSERPSFTKSPQTPGHPDVTMRLETPVVYFYPPTGVDSKHELDVKVQFRGGLLNEFYPKGVAEVVLDYDRINSKMAAGIVKTWSGDVLNNYVTGSLTWTGLKLVDSELLPETSSKIWLSPRKVKSAVVQLNNAEREKYLFYRGVAHLDALVQTKLAGETLTIMNPKTLHWLGVQTLTIPQVWVVAINDKNALNFHEFKALPVTKEASKELIVVELNNDPRSFSKENVSRLRRSIFSALIARGLYNDEAEAMLSTWEDAYFKGPALRLFYIVPQEWVDYFLPMNISVPHELTRVLVGRIDLVSSE